MSDYRRVFVPGGTYFFTLVTARRRPWLVEANASTILDQVMRDVRTARPFETIAAVVLPDHLHCIWRLPEADADYPGRWKRIKDGSTRRLKGRGFGVGPFWQSRYWEHLVRDDEDLARHVAYIHYNPVKHGYVEWPCDWLASSFHRYVASGLLEPDWASPPELDVPE